MAKTKLYDVGTISGDWPQSVFGITWVYALTYIRNLLDDYMAMPSQKAVATKTKQRKSNVYLPNQKCELSYLSRRLLFFLFLLATLSLPNRSRRRVLAAPSVRSLGGMTPDLVTSGENDDRYPSAMNIL